MRTLDQLRNEGVSVEARIEGSEFGRFAWAMDPEGNRMELWEPTGTKDKPLQFATIQFNAGRQAYPAPELLSVFYD